jgi:hypothetical protein
MQTASANITHLQLELMKIFSYNLEEQQLLEIKDILAHYFDERATKEMDKLWLEKGWTNETMEHWSKEHLRTPYK